MIKLEFDYIEKSKLKIYRDENYLSIYWYLSGELRPYLITKVGFN